MEKEKQRLGVKGPIRNASTLAVVADVLGPIQKEVGRVYKESGNSLQAVINHFPQWKVGVLYGGIVNEQIGEYLANVETLDKQMAAIEGGYNE
jgi:hypothetical protein